jgi:hypothetical protein
MQQDEEPIGYQYDAMKKKSRPVEVSKPQSSPHHQQQQYIKNENVISAILALIKDLNIPELEFVRREVNTRIGTLCLNR